MDDRFSISPELRDKFVGETPQARLARSFAKYAKALLAKDSDEIDAVVTPDLCCHELAAMGMPSGPAGLKAFRKAANAAFPDQRVTLTAIRFESDDTLETELACVATHAGEIMGFAPTGREVRWTVWTRGRFAGDRLAERWDRGNLREILGKT